MVLLDLQAGEHAQADEESAEGAESIRCQEDEGCRTQERNRSGGREGQAPGKAMQKVKPDAFSAVMLTFGN